MVNIYVCKCFYFFLKSHQPSGRGFYEKVQPLKMGGSGRGQTSSRNRVWKQEEMDQWETAEPT